MNFFLGVISMKTFFKYGALFSFIISALVFSSCNDNVPSDGSQNQTSNADYINGMTLTCPAADYEVYNEEVVSESLKVIRFTYPTVDLDNNVVNVSAMVCMSNSFFESSDKQIDLLVLNNHASILRGEKSPTSEESGEQWYESLIQGAVPEKNVVSVASDYIGFGKTIEMDQAYCVGVLNARASLDALRCAKKYLIDNGFKFADDYKLINFGYSQGGQTAIAVQKLCDTCADYKDIKITKTYAGAGPYNIKITGEEVLSNDNPYLPAVTLLCVYSFNDYLKLGYENTELFKDFESFKTYMLSNDSKMMGATNKWAKEKGFDSKKFSNYLNDIILPATTSTVNENGQFYAEYLKKIEEETWCQFTPSPSTKIALFHVENDDIVTSANSDFLYDYFNQHGYPMEKKTDLNSTFEGNCYVTFSVPEQSSEDSTHVAGVNYFIQKIGEDLLKL